jgi:hypothetical protein
LTVMQQLTCVFWFVNVFRTHDHACIVGSSMFLEHIINPVHQWIRIARRSLSAAARSENSKHVA